VKTVYIGLGSNLGDRAANLREARERFGAADVRITRESSIFETAPRDLTDQPWFLNQVVEAETDLLPLQLLGKLQKIEKAMGRRRVIAKGPRTIDLDILIFGRAVVHHRGLEIPHPRMKDRRFVLEPLAELVPDMRIPADRNAPDARTVGELLTEVKDQEVRRVNK
jgi:2-amino-4-hydroxy-6-hydroxymethyldihydropteridine diphosphokinase